MVAHRETLRRLVGELASIVGGARLLAVWRQGKSLLFVEIEPPTGEPFLVEVHLRPGMSTFFRRPERWGRPQPLLPWAEGLWGKVIRLVELHPVERQVRWSLHTGEQLILCLFGTAQSGAFVVDDTGKPHAMLGAATEGTEERQWSWDKTSRQLLSWTQYPESTPLLRALASCQQQLGTFYARELCYRCGLSPEMPLGELSASQRESLAIALLHFTTELMGSTEVLLLRRPEGPPLLSLVPLREYPEVAATFTSIHEAVAERVRRTLVWEEFRQQRAALLKTIDRHCRQVEHQCVELRARCEQASRSELYRLWGSLLLSQPDLHQRGREEIVLADWEGKPHRIPLNPAQTLRENADAYFQRARRLEHSCSYALQRLPVLEEQRDRLQHLHDQVAQAHSLRQLRQLAQRLREEFPPREIQLKTGERFRVFNLPHGYSLYVGKDANSNDALTFSYAKPHDLFLHVRGAPGAHGILRGPVKGQLPPQEVLEQAAAIVAYYSRLRSSGSVPVVYTWRKYVRKVRGIPGAVRLEREEVIWVTPMREAKKSE
ncbi:MAG: NFACT RNA binding domain-containing protein [Candidatus Kapabacteria bacterium]|nr:NFACT RNA binding domain-containing protein [Candidatus Kapabacteria bacterium]MDW8012300.1 NFACT RNA binding domain-containing protein [Bacteroidota bacterium]